MHSTGSNPILRPKLAIITDMEKRPIQGRAILALACTVLMLFVPNYAQYQLSPLAHLIMPTYDLDAAQFSMLFSAAMVAGIVFSLIAGILCDRFGVKRVVGIVSIVSVGALIVRIYAPNFAILFVCMVLAGLIATFVNANTAKIMGSWFPPEFVGVTVGIAMAGSTLAMVVGIGTSALFPSVQAVFIFTAIVAVVTLIAWWVFFKDGPNSTLGASGENDGTATAAQPPLSECLKVALKSRNVWIVGVILGLNMASTMCILTFMPQVLQSTRGFDPTAAGALSSVITCGNLVGAIVVPIIGTRIGRFKPVAIVVATVSAFCTAFAWQMPEGPAMLVCFFLTGFTLSGIMTTLISVVVLLPEIGPVYAGTAGGVAATLQLFGAVVIPSYILTPILGTNYPVLYGIAGAMCLVVAACVFVLPEVFGHGPKE